LSSEDLTSSSLIGGSSYPPPLNPLPHHVFIIIGSQMTGEENLPPPSLPTPFFLLNGFGVFLEGEPDNLTC